MADQENSKSTGAICKRNQSQIQVTVDGNDLWQTKSLGADWSGLTEEEEQRVLRQRRTDGNPVTNSTLETMDESSGARDSDNFKLFLSQTQDCAVSRPTMLPGEIEEVYRRLYSTAIANICGLQGEVYENATILSLFQDVTLAKYLVFTPPGSQQPPVTMRLLDLRSLQLLTEAELTEEENILCRADTNPVELFEPEQSPSLLYPSLVTHWQDLGLPLAPNGDVDVMLFQAMYHFHRQHLETEPEFAHRIGLDAYRSEKNVKDTAPLIYHHLARVLPEKCFDIKSAWFNEYPVHQLSFPDWWAHQGSMLTWTDWANGQGHTYGQELNFRIQMKQSNARDFILSAPENLKPKIVSLFGHWSFSLLNEHFSELKDFVQTDAEYAKLEKANRPTTTNDESIQDLPDDVDDWHLYVPDEEHPVNAKSMWTYLKRFDPTMMHTEQLIMTDTIYSQTMMDPKCKITVSDFMPNGRLAHIFIPNYVYVPPLAVEIITGVRTILTKDLHLLWRRMHQARGRAATLMNMSTDIWDDSNQENPLPHLQTLWRSEIQKSKELETPFSNIDELQHIQAHLMSTQEETFANKTNVEKIRDLYDMHIRDKERLFTCDMPLSKELLHAQYDIVKQKWLFSTIVKISGFNHWPKGSTTFILKELSKIRLLFQTALIENYVQNWNPVSRKSSMFFAITNVTNDIFESPHFDGYVEVSDFYPGGRLYGIHVRNDKQLPDHIISRFTKRQLTDEMRKKLHYEIITTRSQWSHQVTTQLAIQNGQEPKLDRLQAPDWIYDIGLVSHIQQHKSEQLAFRHIEERCKNLQITHRDFLRNGRLSTFPTEGTKVMTLDILRNLNFPENLHKKECTYVLGYIHQFIRENLNKIVLARKNEKLVMSPPPATPPTQKANFIHYKTQRSQHYASDSQYYRNRESERTPPSYRARSQQRQMHRSPPITRSTTKRAASVSRILFSSDPIPEETRTITRTLTESTDPEITQPFEKWLKKEKEIKLGTPPMITDTIQTTETITTPTPISIPPPIFIPKTIFENPFAWDGTPQNAPKWAKMAVSADTLNEIKENRIPAAHRSRNVISMCYRQIPLDGINRVSDIYMNQYEGNVTDVRDFGVEINSISKQRGTDSTQSESVSMRIPFLDTANFRSILHEAEKAVLPAAVDDLEKEETTLYTTTSQASYFQYQAQIVVIRAECGSERILSISQSNYADKVFSGLSIPWRYTSPFLIKFNTVQQEIAFMQNEKQKVKRGFIRQPEPARMNRQELLDIENNSLRFQEKQISPSV